MSLCLVQDGDSVPLVRASLSKVSTQLSHDDLVRLARRLTLDLGSQDSRNDLLIGIALHVSNNNHEFANSVAQASSEEQGCNLLAQDPWVEKMFGELDEDDKREFQDVGDEIRKQRIKHRVSDGCGKTIQLF